MIRTIFLRAKRNQNLATIVINRGPTGPKGDDGSGGGDMAAATYDPQGIADDAFAMENMTEGADAKVMSAAERNAIAALGTASTREADQDLRTTDAVEFNTVTVDTVNLHTAAFDTTNGGPTALGEMAWDSVDGTLDIQADGGVKIPLVGGMIRVRNVSGAVIAKGAPLVYVGTNGASTRINVRPWIGESISDVRQFLGFAAGAIADNADGYATWFGKIAEIPTDGGAELWDDGDIIYAIPGASATLSNIRPTSGDYVTAAVVINAGSGTSGSIFVRPTFDTVPAASVINFDDLGDATTVDLPTVNTPLGTALELKTNSADLGTAAYQNADQNLQTTDDVYFNSVNSTGRLGLNSLPSYAGAVSIFGSFNQSSPTGPVAMFIANDGTNLRASGLWVRAGVNSYQSCSFYCTDRNNNPILLAHGNGNVGIGISQNDYPAEKLEVAGNIKSSGTIQPGTYTVATLPTGVAGMRATVSDSDQPAQGNFGNTVVAAGAGTPYVVPVFFDGTNWIIA